MNRYLALSAAGSVAAAMIHLNFLIGTVAGLVLAIVLTPRNITKRVIIEDVTTGQMKIQPNDRTTQSYINQQEKNN